MTEHSAADLEFEAVLEQRLRARASLASTAERPFDAAQVAAAAVVARPSRRLELPVRLRAVAWGWVAVAALLAITAATLIAGAALHDWYAGPWLALATQDGIVLAHADGTRPHRISAITSEMPMTLRWSGDGRYLLVIRLPDGQDSEGMRLEVIDGEGGLVWSTPASDGATWSSTGHRLAWTRSPNDDLVVTDVASGATSLLLAGDENGILRIGTWSPDDRWLQVQRWDAALDGAVALLLPSAGGAPRRLGVDASVWVSAATWSPDGAHVAMGTEAMQENCTTVDACRSTVAILDVATGLQEEEMAIRSFAATPRWSPDGARIAWIEAATVNGAETEVILYLPDENWEHYRQVVGQSPRPGRALTARAPLTLAISCGRRQPHRSPQRA